MSLTPGTPFGSYEIIGPLGAGGMGEVYRARDTRLKREVALKVLPESVAGDSDRAARFQREAELLATLNHPNIAAIHGIEESAVVVSGVGRTMRALVLELVEGETLADRIARGPISVDEAVALAKQIAEALEAAHEQGVIHRDLKPANIKVRSDGTVKVLDFGLAKLIEPGSGTGDPGAAGATAAPTITSPAVMTNVGVILGTAAYMSPEQARGKAVDKRADIWAFGCVLYEMLTGRRAFDGDDVSEVLASVLAREPNWTLLPAGLAPVLEGFIRRCLDKDRKQRVGDAQSLRLAIEGAFETGISVSSSGVKPTRAPMWRGVLSMAAASFVGVAVAGLAAWSLWPATGPLPVSRFDYTLPSGQQFRNVGRPVIATSPDGRYFAYNSSQGLYLRAMDDLRARLIPGTEGGLTNPFFSPDGEAIAYEQGRELKRVSIRGGAPVVICAAATLMFGASWGADNVILFGQTGGIMRVSANGGTPELVIKANEGEQVHGPQVLPDGESVLFSVTTGRGVSRWDRAQIVVQSLRTGERKVLIQGGSDARYVGTGHLVYAVGETLLAVAFDAERLEVRGGAVSVVDGIMRVDAPATTSGTANYGVSDDGTLVYVTGSNAVPSGTLVWVGRNGKFESLSDRQAPYRSPRISPDGARVAVAMQGPDGNEDIWVIDVERGTHTRLTTAAELETLPLWTPDGTRIAFSSGRAGGANALYWMSADGNGPLDELTKATTNQGATSWLSDGTTLAFYDVGGTYDIFTLRPGESPVRFSETPFRERGPTFSPDGRWLAYSSDETGQTEIYVAPYPGPGGRTAISAGGGRSPLWSSNGRELFYRNGRQMMGVGVETGTSFRAGAPRLLFEGDYIEELDNTGAHNYDVSRDGQRFLMVAAVAQAQIEQTRPRIVVVENWFQELKRRVPTN